MALWICLPQDRWELSRYTPVFGDEISWQRAQALWRMFNGTVLVEKFGMFPYLLAPILAPILLAAFLYGPMLVMAG